MQSCRSSLADLLGTADITRLVFDFSCDLDLLCRLAGASRDLRNGAHLDAHWKRRCFESWPWTNGCIPFVSRKGGKFILDPDGANWGTTFTALRFLRFKRVWPSFELVSKMRLSKLQDNASTRPLVDILTESRLTMDQKMTDYLFLRHTFSNRDQMALDKLACQHGLPLPTEPDGKPWTATWPSPETICATGVPASLKVMDMIDNLFNKHHDDRWRLWLSARILADPLPLSAGRQERVYHGFVLPLPLQEGVFAVTFSLQLGGKWGGLVGIADASTHKPVLAFDMGGCADENSLGFLTFSALCQRLANIEIEGWDHCQPVHGSIDNTIESGLVRMVLVIDVDAGSLALWQQSDVSPPRSVARMRQKPRLVRKMGPLVRGFRGNQIFFGLSTDVDFEGDAGSIVRIERIVPMTAGYQAGSW